MTGFPGESDEEWAEGLALIRAAQFDGMHIFKYSPRPGTRAWQMPHQVPEPVKAERSAILREEA